ncbi:MAG: hypothetical protein L0Z62_05115 [Gemmataceae bacterium]|nr:hypothetical protein [Gemmataceae bacterium]
MDRREAKKGRFRIEQLEERIAPTITTTTFTVKVPGPTDFIVTTATNPGGNHPPGHQSTVEVANRFAR